MPRQRFYGWLGLVFLRKSVMTESQCHVKAIMLSYVVRCGGTWLQHGRTWLQGDITWLELRRTWFPYYLPVFLKPVDVGIIYIIYTAKDCISALTVISVLSGHYKRNSVVF